MFDAVLRGPTMHAAKAIKEVFSLDQDFRRFAKVNCRACTGSTPPSRHAAHLQPVPATQAAGRGYMTVQASGVSWKRPIMIWPGSRSFGLLARQGGVFVLGCLTGRSTAAAEAMPSRSHERVATRWSPVTGQGEAQIMGDGPLEVRFAFKVALDSLYRAPADSFSPRASSVPTAPGRRYHAFSPIRLHHFSNLAWVSGKKTIG